MGACQIVRRAAQCNDCLKERNRVRSPVYPEVEMAGIMIEGVHIDCCPRRGGHRLDGGELAQHLIGVKKSQACSQRISLC